MSNEEKNIVGRDLKFVVISDSRDVVAADSGGTQPEPVKFASFVETEAQAKKLAEELALKNDGVKFYVFTLVGLAQLQHKVEWEGAGK